MSTPELPQPIYPGAQPAGRGSAPGAPAPQSAPAGGARQTGYAPVVPSGGGRPPGRGSGIGRWLIIGGAAVVVVAVIVVAAVTLTRGAAPEEGGSAGTSASPTPDSGATSNSGGSEDPEDPEVSDAVAGMWAGMATTAEQGCVFEAAAADPALAGAITDYYYDGTTTIGGAALLAGVNVDCLPKESLEDVILAAPITPTCDWYDFSSLNDADWRKLLNDGYLTMGGFATPEEFGAAWFPGCYFPE